jgi:hypothetical protein
LNSHEKWQEFSPPAETPLPVLKVTLFPYESINNGMLSYPHLPLTIREAELCPKHLLTRQQKKILKEQAFS